MVLQQYLEILDISPSRDTIFFLDMSKGKIIQAHGPWPETSSVYSTL